MFVVGRECVMTIFFLVSGKTGLWNLLGVEGCSCFSVFSSFDRTSALSCEHYVPSSAADLRMTAFAHGGPSPPLPC